MAKRKVTSEVKESITDEIPLVSVLLCQRNCRELASTLAIPSYLQQDYPNLELVVVEDGTESILDLVEDIPNLVYLQHPADNLSQKRNAGIRSAHGEIIVHLDADDWSGPHRVSDQVEMLRANPEAQIAGYGKALWFDFVTGKASHYRGSPWGASIAYRREYALAHPWNETVSLAEDGPFINGTPCVSKDGAQNFVATLHTKNARRAAVGMPDFWPFVDLRQLPEGFRRAAGI